jgi:hypothetical protein
VSAYQQQRTSQKRRHAHTHALLEQSHRISVGIVVCVSMRVVVNTSIVVGDVCTSDLDAHSVRGGSGGSATLRALWRRVRRDCSAFVFAIARRLVTVTFAILVDTRPALVSMRIVAFGRVVIVGDARLYGKRELRLK